MFKPLQLLEHKFDPDFYLHLQLLNLDLAKIFVVLQPGIALREVSDLPIYEIGKILFLRKQQKVSR